VLARAAWGGNRRQIGFRSGRLYPRTSSNGPQVWIDPNDAIAAPHMWQIVPLAKPEPDPAPTTPEPTPDWTKTATSIVRAMLPPGARPQAAPYTNVLEPTAEAVAVRPAVQRVMRTVGTPLPTAPIFAWPRKHYPSYDDLRRLVSLSGYTSCYIDEMTDGLYIVASPEQHDLAHATGRVIRWQFEYVGDYTNNHDGWQGEQWSSDLAHAARTGARFVELGSHTGLRTMWYTPDTGAYNGKRVYDVTMLAYLTPRRTAIKQQLNGLRWPIDYPGSGQDRHTILERTRLMLQVHQHSSAANAPQRIALAAAYRLPVVSEWFEAGKLEDMVALRKYVELPNAVVNLSDTTLDTLAADLHEYLCHEMTFAKAIKEALA